MKEKMNKGAVKALVFCVLLGTVLSGCRDGGGGRVYLTLSGTVNVILDGARPERVDIVIYTDDTFPDDSYITRTELSNYKTSGNNNWSVSIAAFSAPTDLYIQTRIFHPGTERWYASSYHGKHTQITDVYQDNVIDINLGNFTRISLTGTVGTVKANGITMPRNDMYVATYRSSDGKWLYDSRIFDDGNWYATLEPFNQQDSVKLHLIFGVADGYYDYEADTGKTTQVYNTKVSGIAIGNVEVSTKTITGTVIGENIRSVSALSSSFTKQELDENLWEIKWLGQTFAKDFNQTSWTMKLVSTTAQELWFLVRDTEGNRYLSTAAIDTISPVNLNVSLMTKIIEAPPAPSSSVLQTPLIRGVYTHGSATAATGTPAGEGR